MAIGILAVLSIAGGTVIYLTSSNGRSASYSKGSATAYDLAEAGINEAVAILAKPENNAFDPTLLPTANAPHTSTYAGGTVSWSAALDVPTSVWTITSLGRVKNPTGPATADIVRTVKAKVKALAPDPQPAQTQAWNFLYSGRTGNTCDMSLSQRGDVTAPLYVAGNLCLSNNTSLLRGPVHVAGSVAISTTQSSIGKSSSPVSEAHIGAGCQYRTSAFDNPCPGAVDNVFATVLDAKPALIPFPTADWDGAYKNANPGPFYPCQTTSGSPPTFDTAERLRNNSVPGVFNLTPSGSSYSCKTNAGELSWDATKKLLTVSGTIYIDGSATSEISGVALYQGQATLYVTGTFLMKTSKLCAVISANKCDFSAWDPNKSLLIIAAAGSGGQVLQGDSVQLIGAQFQGGIYGTNAIDLDTTSSSQGPLVGSTVSLGQASDASFPKIAIVPPAAPGNTASWSKISAPYDYSG